MGKLKLAEEVSGIDPLYPSGYLQRILYLCSVLLGLTIAACQGQNSLPQGRFLSDSIDVGKPVFYALSFRHSQEKEVFFPDTTYNFAPFEVLSQKIFTSSTDEKGMLDSAIYQLISFDVAAAQVLQVPVFVFEKRDCTAVLSAPDTVFLKKEDLNILESQKALTPDTVLLPLNREFNFSKLIGTLAMIIGIGGSIYWVFGNDISKQWRLIKLQRRHLEYLRSFNRLLRNARDKGSIKDAEKAIIVWKNYLERLEKKPFATYTTREIMDNMPDENLAEALKNMDGMIYGQARSKKMDASLEVLKAGATKIYRNRRRQILDRQES
ncbi:hypothetical protein DYBT9275_04762 [Dyadobacter sp. CECT 9275]|uniref:Uncharacterized protein n=1 Tax=Dyadobacter helix TaxID=2822344 RepID=A0A916JGK3_9BACT|nr:hypothetical protein [Dyadobacter sp. CECT 9275]CAG5010576.1 hypothetical protein DYBT9275_04762 [Dyadobacter sp. CECT 9275]